MQQHTAHRSGPPCILRASSSGPRRTASQLPPHLEPHRAAGRFVRQPFRQTTVPLRSQQPRPCRQGPRCSAATQLVQPVSQQATGLLTTLQQSPLLRDTCAMMVATAGAVALVKVFEKLVREGVIGQKLSRKLVHILAGPGFALTWPLFSAAPHARFFAAVVPTLNLLRVVLLGTGVVHDERTVNAMSREGDRAELLRGPLYYVLVLMAATTLYWRESPVGVVAFSLMCGGDGLADIVGRRFGGSARLPWNGAKSWAGSGAMLAGGFCMALGFVAYFTSLGYFDCDMPAMAASIAAIAAAATLIESLPINQALDDNISVPGAVALLGFLLRNAMVAA